MKRWMAPVVLLAMTLPVLCLADVGSKPGDFRLTDMRGHKKSFRSPAHLATVVTFFSTRCPMSNAFNYRRNVLYHDYGKQLRFIAVDSNANESLEEIRAYARNVHFDFPVYRDVGAAAADLFGARNTTESFVLDASGVVRYRGYIEDAPNPERTKVQGLRRAIQAVLDGRQVDTPETRGIGCAIRRAPAAVRADKR